MSTGLKDEQIRQQVLAAMKEEAPLATYRKATMGRVLVKYLDPIRLIPLEKVLNGSAEDGKSDEDSYTISVWSEAEERYFQSANKTHFKNGTLIPHTAVVQGSYTVNQISDESIEEILTKPFFTLQAKLKEFTSPIPVRRMLAAAEKLNRPVRTIEYLKETLAQMEQTVPEPSRQAQGVIDVIELDV